MKKVLISIIVVLLVLTTVFAFACKKEAPKAAGEYTIVSPEGAPALALASFAKNSKISDTLTIKPSIVSATLIKSEAIKSDFAIVPANMASIIYNGGEEYCMVGTVTNGNMYIVSNEADSDFSLEKMKGHVLYSIGQGSIPAFILLNILQKAEIPFEVSETPVAGKVAITYCQDGKALMIKMKSASTKVYGNLPEPAVTTYVAAGGNRVADLQELWKAATSSSITGFAQAVLIAKKSLCENNKEVVTAVYNAMVKNETYVVEHAEEAREALSGLAENIGFNAPLLAQVVRNCNVKMYRASENKDYIITSLEAAHKINPASVGGSVPAKDSGFYF